jgi:hypothetical protein
MTLARNVWRETYNKWLTKIIFIRFTTTIYKKIQELFEIHMLLEVLISIYKPAQEGHRLSIIYYNHIGRGSSYSHSSDD